MINLDNIFPIGIGTFRIDLNDKEISKEAILHSINMGQNYIDVSSMYQDGEVMKFIGEVIKDIDRNKLFISCKISNDIEKIEDIEIYLNKYLGMLGIGYVDCLEFHAPDFCKIDIVDAYKEMKRLIDKGLIRYLGISNCSLDMLIELNENVSIDIFDGVYNFECREYEKNGVLKYCIDNNIKFVCYQPLRRNRTAKRNYPLLIELSDKYNKTQNQIILNWIINEKKIIPIIKTTNIDRINENLVSRNFEISIEDIKRLNDFIAEDFDKIIIDWSNNGGVAIDKLANQFE